MGLFDRNKRRSEDETPVSVVYEDQEWQEPGTVGVGAFARPYEAEVMIDESMITPVIGKDQLREANQTLREYMAGKRTLIDGVVA